MFANMKVRNKIVISFGVALLLFGAMIFFAIVRMGTLNNAVEQVVQANSARTQAVTAALDHAHTGMARVAALIATVDAEQTSKLKAEVAANSKTINDAIEKLPLKGRSLEEKATLNKLRSSHDGITRALQSATVQRVQEPSQLKAEIAANAKAFNDVIDKLASAGDSPQEKAVLDTFKQSAVQYMTSIDQALGLIDTGKVDDAIKSVSGGDTSTALNLFISRLHTLNEHQRTKMEAASGFNRETYESTRNTVLGLGALALILFILAAVVITVQVANQLGGEPTFAAKAANKVAQGDLRVVIHTMKNDRSSMLYAIRTLRDSLDNIVGKVRHGTDTIAVASARLAHGNLELSSRTEQQASALEETASSMEQLTATVKQNADNARQANQLAISASDVAIKGGAVVSQVVETMGAINDSAKKIVDIISVIDGIAFQTNILALNAAVEAARAGEQGRGFAVVAAEVRSLAQRSASAAKEIKALIGTSVEKVDAGSSLVTKAGATMEEVVESVKRVTDIMAEIMTASQEQSSGIEQVNQALVQMDRVTQQNASLVEEAAASAAALKDQASDLAQVVSVFQLNSNQSAEPVKAALNAPVRTVTPARIPRERTAAIAQMPKHPPANVPQENARRKNLSHTGAPAGSDWEEF